MFVEFIVVKALGIVKKAAANVNKGFGLDSKIADAINTAAGKYIYMMSFIHFILKIKTIMQLIY